MTSGLAWSCERSVEAAVPRSVAWHFMADVRNWSDPPAEFSLDGPFASGTIGYTRMPGQPAHSWILRDVELERGYTIEGGSFLDRAVLLVHWRFEALSHERTLLTQRMELGGENAAAYVEGIRSGFEPNLEPGMRRIAGMMEQAHARRR